MLDLIIILGTLLDNPVHWQEAEKMSVGLDQGRM